MELRAFAERVLFGTSLDDKLADPGEVTDECPGSAVEAPAVPGRPVGLGFKAAGTGPSPVPASDRLADPEIRARLLHFFANHELLATELMALVLLRFPEAPAAFRAGVFRTLRDEQAHTRMYMRRLEQCGVRFGDIPVSGFFWRALAPLDSPVDYVAGLSLTFEQANLDYCRHFSAAFAGAGDGATAGLLDRVYRDEIAHVAYGLKWFRKWKPAGMSDWDAFCRQLRFPLSPQRAKGFSMNVPGRQAAGLDPEFIAALEVYSRSRGRTPRVHWFNPSAEASFLPGCPPRPKVDALARDLATLPVAMARRDDVVIVREDPPTALRRDWIAAGLDLPEFVVVPGDSPDAGTTLGERRLGGLCPWGWAPDSDRFLGPLRDRVTAADPGPDPADVAAWGVLYSKASAASLADRIAREFPRPWMDGPDCIGRVARSAREALGIVAAWRASGWHRLVAKRSVGVAGGNALRLWEPDLLPAQQAWIERNVSPDFPLVIEPWLERVAEFSMQFERGEGGVRPVGFPGLETDLRGQYLGSRAEPGWRIRPPGAVFAALGPEGAREWPEVVKLVQTLLEEWLRPWRFRGAVGVDCLVHRMPDGRTRLRPMVEINPRCTMGRVTCELMRLAAPGRTGAFRIHNRASLRSVGAGSFAELLRLLQAAAPVVRSGQPVARVTSGAIALNDPASADAALAVFIVEPGPGGRRSGR